MKGWMLQNLATPQRCGREKVRWSSIFGLTCWKIWEARNKAIFQHKHISPENLGREILILAGFNSQAAIKLSEAKGGRVGQREQLSLVRNNGEQPNANTSWSINTTPVESDWRITISHDIVKQHLKYLHPAQATVKSSAEILSSSLVLLELRFLGGIRVPSFVSRILSIGNSMASLKRRIRKQELDLAISHEESYCVDYCYGDNEENEMIYSRDICENHPQGVVLVKFKDRKDAQKCIELMNGRWFGRKQIHASEDDGSVDHTIIRDYKGDAMRLEQFSTELEAD
ncbi:hypothetical protein K1719_014435 [Acacia pycnantha]|nr:hypothetical protein K1719_014435 [Acacia pycnantha]